MTYRKPAKYVAAMHMVIGFLLKIRHKRFPSGSWQGDVFSTNVGISTEMMMIHELSHRHQKPKTRCALFLHISLSFYVAFRQSMLYCTTL